MANTIFRAEQGIYTGGNTGGQGIIVLTYTVPTVENPIPESFFAFF